MSRSFFLTEKVNSPSVPVSVSPGGSVMDLYNTRDFLFMAPGGPGGLAMEPNDKITAIKSLVEWGLDEIPTKLRKRAAKLQREARGLLKEAESLEILKSLIFGKEIPGQVAAQGGES